MLVYTGEVLMDKSATKYVKRINARNQNQWILLRFD